MFQSGTGRPRGTFFLLRQLFLNDRMCRERERKVISALMLVIAVVALVHFGVHYWRALLAGVASEPLSERMQAMAGETLGAGDFDRVLCYQKMCPGLDSREGRVGVVRAYYRILSALSNTLGALLPRVSAWTNREMATCSRYVVVVTDRRLQRNLAQVAEIHSY